MNKQITLKNIFNALQTPHLVLDIDYPTLTILEENPAHERVAMTKRDDVIGRPFLEVYPDTSEEFARTGKSVVVESIKTVIDTKKPDPMPDIQYDIKDASGKMVVRYWSAVHYPVFDDAGELIAVYQETKDITDQRKISEKLNQAKLQLDQVLSNSRVGTWNWDITNQVVTTDPNLASMFGINSEEAAAGLPLKTFIDSIHPDDQAHVQELIKTAIETKQPYEAEYRTVSTDGSLRNVLARGTVYYGENDEATVFSGTIIDITDRKRAEAALKDSEERLRFMADSMPQLVWITKPDGYHEYYNQRWYDYTGTKPGTTDGEGWNDLFHPDDQARARKIWNKSLKTGEPYEIEYRLYHAPTKRYRWVIGRAMPFTDSEGKILKWYGTCTDIDEQKHTSEIQSFLAEMSRELASSLDTKKILSTVAKLSVPVVADWCSVDILNAQADGFTQVALAHRDKSKRELAKKYRELHPLTPDQPTGVPQVVRTGETEAYLDIDQNLIKQRVKDKEVRELLDAIGIRSLVVVPLRIRDTVVGGISFISSDSGRLFTDQDIGLMEDVASRLSMMMTNGRLYDESQADLKRRRQLEHSLTQEKQKLELRVKERTKQLQLTNEGLRDEIAKRHRAEKEITDYSAELRRSNEELENFAYVASHDLQEPLRKIQAFSNLLVAEQTEQLNEDGRMYVDRMQAAAGRMSTLIEDLLTFSRVSRRPASHTPVDLNKIVREVMIDLETRIDETGANVEVGQLPTVVADATQMRQLFQNLIGNALKFHKIDEAPNVTVTSKKIKGNCVIQVTDSGIGFDEKYKDRIFSVFQRLNTRSSYEGTGIGLAVCRKIVERYNGTITASSQKDEGATFTVKLPVKGEKRGTA